MYRFKISITLIQMKTKIKSFNFRLFQFFTSVIRLMNVISVLSTFEGVQLHTDVFNQKISYPLFSSRYNYWHPLFVIGCTYSLISFTIVYFANIFIFSCAKIVHFQHSKLYWKMAHFSRVEYFTPFSYSPWCCENNLQKIFELR